MIVKNPGLNNLIRAVAVIQFGHIWLVYIRNALITQFFQPRQQNFIRWHKFKNKYC